MSKIANTAASLCLLDLLLIGFTCVVVGGDPAPDAYIWFIGEGLILVILAAIWSVASRFDRIQAEKIYNDPFHGGRK